MENPSCIGCTDMVFPQSVLPCGFWDVLCYESLVTLTTAHPLIQRMYFQISCKFIWLIPRICFEMHLILWKNPFYIDYIAMVFPKCVSSCGLLYCSYLSNAFIPQRGEIPIIHSSQLFILILTYCQNNICKSSTI